MFASLGLFGKANATEYMASTSSLYGVLAIEYKLEVGMVVARYGKDLIPFCESKGLAEVRRLRNVESHFHALDQPLVDRWVSVKEAELRDESVSIARKALDIARRANIYAIIAMILAVLATIIAAVIGVKFGK